ncbi:glycosyltransferase family 61 protein [Opitutus terrae]|nr:glycosyltransferase family 61 protein [Opitutus terrae]
MWSPRKTAQSLRFHARRLRTRALAAPRAVPWLRQALRLPRNEVFDPLAGESVAGVHVIPLDPAASFHRPLPRFVEPHPMAERFFAQRTHEVTAPTYVVDLADAIAWGHPTGGVFTPDGRFVPAFTHDPSGAALHTAWTRLRLPRPKPLPGRTLYLVTPEATDNFHHWMIDLLPRLGLVERAGFRVPDFDHVIVNHAHRRYQTETLARLGIPLDRVITADAALFVRAEHLVVPALKQHHQSLPAADVTFLRRALLGHSTSSSPASRRLFLSRADASYRRLRHEADRHDWLRAHDFEIVRPGDLTVAEQARLFAEADVIAGPAGAAFANLVFARPGTQVIEIVPPQWIAAFHWMISARCGLHHTVVLGEGPVMREPPGAGARQHDIVLSAQKFTRALSLAGAPAAA